MGTELGPSSRALVRRVTLRIESGTHSRLSVCVLGRGRRSVESRRAADKGLDVRQRVVCFVLRSWSRAGGGGRRGGVRRAQSGSVVSSCEGRRVCCFFLCASFVRWSRVESGGEHGAVTWCDADAQGRARSHGAHSSFHVGEARRGEGRCCSRCARAAGGARDVGFEGERERSTSASSAVSRWGREGNWRPCRLMVDA